MSANGDAVDENPNETVVRIRGLPWQATKEEVLNFFSDCKIKGGDKGIHIVLSREGRPSGEAYIEMDNHEDFTKAVEYHRKTMGSRYIEVFPSNQSELDWAKRDGPCAGIEDDGTCVRLRGLPYGAVKQDVTDFLPGFEIGAGGVIITLDRWGKMTGDAYVQFTTKDFAEKAMGKHREKMGPRYIEVFKISRQEFEAVANYHKFGEQSQGGHFAGGGAPPRDFYEERDYGYGGGRGGPMRYGGPGGRPGPYDRYPPRGGGGGGGYDMGGGYRGPNPRRDWDDRGYDDGGASGGGGGAGYGGRGGGGYDRASDDIFSNPRYANGRHTIHMRGLPFRASEFDVEEFFRPLKPVDIRLLRDETGRSTGEADVEFPTHEDALQAMSRDKANMNHRYIELFIRSSPSPAPQPVPPPSHSQAVYASDMASYQARSAYGQSQSQVSSGSVGSALAGISMMGGLFGSTGGQQSRGQQPAYQTYAGYASNGQGSRM
ncbi:Heterogeneous nuclear ribonucleoprotein F [Halotydeus destructor]|nr:Heterogeneous nuclear ribonucleoprotein F [Halotydeus destructor]